MWPVAGASTRITSASRLRSICLILPRTRMSRMPGIAPATRSTMPVAMSRLDTRPRPWSARYSRRASSGVMVRARTEPAGTAESSSPSSVVAPAARRTEPA